MLQIPKSIAIIGSGYIAVEFAGIFHGLGSDVHLVFRKDMPLNGFDGEVSNSLTEFPIRLFLHVSFSAIHDAPHGAPVVRKDMPLNGFDGEVSNS